MQTQSQHLQLQVPCKMPKRIKIEIYEGPNKWRIKQKLTNRSF